MDQFEAHVIWGDGLGDSARICAICWSNTCIKPVHAEQYKTLVNFIAQKWDKDNPAV